MEFAGIVCLATSTVKRNPTNKWTQESIVSLFSALSVHGVWTGRGVCQKSQVAPTRLRIAQAAQRILSCHNCSKDSLRLVAIRNLPTKRQCKRKKSLEHCGRIAILHDGVHSQHQIGKGFADTLSLMQLCEVSCVKVSWLGMHTLHLPLQAHPHCHFAGRWTKPLLLFAYGF